MEERRAPSSLRRLRSRSSQGGDNLSSTLHYNVKKQDEVNEHHLVARLSEQRIQQHPKRAPTPDTGRPTHCGVYQAYFFANPCVSADSGFGSMGDIAEDVTPPTDEESVSFAHAQYSESISVGVTSREPLPSYASFVDYKVSSRQKQTVHFGPCLRPVGYQNKLIVYKDSTRKKYKSIVKYEPRNTPVRFSETCYMRPRHAEQTFISCVDAGGLPDRKWYQTTLQLIPVTHSCSHVARFEMNTAAQLDSDGEGDEYEDTVFSEDVRMRMQALTSRGVTNHVTYNGPTAFTNGIGQHPQQSFSTSLFVNGHVESDLNLHNGYIDDESTA